LEEFVQFVSPAFVEALVEDLESELVLVEAFTELLPGNLFSHLLEIAGDFAFVFGVGVPARASIPPWRKRK